MDVTSAYRHYYTYTASPLGRLMLVSSGTPITGLYMQGEQYERHPAADWTETGELEVFTSATRQLAAYFDGHLRQFDLPIALEGSDFQSRVWQLLTCIPYGSTTTYGALGRTLGDAAAARTIGHTIGLNPISLIVPCHRVVAASGALTGYNGGLARKRQLLDLEAGRLQFAL